MSVISIHSLDKSVERRVRAKARQERKSLNQTIKEILSASFGGEPSIPSVRRDEFNEFLGIWSQQDLDDFKAATSDLDRVEPADWR